MYYILQKFLIVILGLAIIGTGLQLSRQLHKKYVLTQELNSIEANIEKISAKNAQLQNKVEALENKDLLKLELKEKFNLQEEGEIVVALKKSQELRGNNQEKIQNIKKDQNYILQAFALQWKKWTNVLLGF